MRGDAEACKKKHGHCKWWLHSEKQNGPSKRFITFPNRALLDRSDATSTCGASEDDAGLMADFARVADGREPKNFPEFWNSSRRVLENCVVPAAAPVVFRGVVRVNGRASVGASEAASSIEAEIKSAIASKPDLAEVLLDVAEWKRGFALKGQQVIDLRAAGITTIAGLALADVDKPEHVRAVTTNRDESQARAAFWSKKHAAAKRLGVKIGSLPAKTSRKERPRTPMRHYPASRVVLFPRSSVDFYIRPQNGRSLGEARAHEGRDVRGGLRTSAIAGTCTLRRFRRRRRRGARAVAAKKRRRRHL